jgi:FkbM family methyltransferase
MISGSKLRLAADFLIVPRRITAALSMYHRPLGIRGVLAFSCHHLFGWPNELAIVSPGVRTPVHLRLRTSDVSVYNEVLLGGQYALDLPFRVQTIIDVGANIGMASLYYVQKYPDARIVAVEAEASNFAILTRNVKPYPNILPIHAALWKKDGEILIATPSSSEPPFSKVGFVVNEVEGAPVRAVTMRTLMRETQIDYIDLLKVDIEGAEKEVFQSCDWMGSVRCLAIELHDRFKPGSSAAVDSVTRDFVKSQIGEISFFVQKRTMPVPICTHLEGDQNDPRESREYPADEH